MLCWAMEHTHHNPSCFHHLKSKKMIIQEKITIGISFKQHQDVCKKKFWLVKRMMENFIKEHIFD
jgi:hypothetical protein